jgi:hypothetical protein
MTMQELEEMDPEPMVDWIQRMLLERAFGPCGEASEEDMALAESARDLLPTLFPKSINSVH